MTFIFTIATLYLLIANRFLVTDFISQFNFISCNIAFYLTTLFLIIVTSMSQISDTSIGSSANMPTNLHGAVLYLTFISF